MFEYPWGTSEDDLTRDFFGLMKYLPGDILLMPFLNLIQNLYPDRKILPQAIKSEDIMLWPTYQIKEEWQDQFYKNMPPERRRSKYYIVPDVVIPSVEYLLVVEAEKSHSVEPEQMFQQYMIAKDILFSENKNRGLLNLLINTSQIPPSFCNVHLEDDKPTGISISQSDSIPKYIAKRAKMVGKYYDEREVRSSYLWISWHHIGKLAEEVLDVQVAKGNEIPRVNARFLTGLKELMDKEGFYPINTLPPDDSLQIDVDTIPITKRIPDFNLNVYETIIEPSFIPLLMGK